MKLIICNSKNWFTLDKEIYKNHSIKVITKKNELTEKFLEDYNPDYVFFTHWNWIVSKEIHNKFTCIVFHTAPLPFGRGGSPIQNLILKGIESSPVCALKMTEDIDAGPIYSKIEVSLQGSLKEIFHRINLAANKLIARIINNKITPVEQIGEPTLFNRLKDNELPRDIDLKEIYDRVRMLDHDDYPKSYIVYGKNKFEFFDADYENDFINLKCKISKY